MSQIVTLHFASMCALGLIVLGAAYLLTGAARASLRRRRLRRWVISITVH